MTTELHDTTAAAAVIAPEAHELYGLLLAVPLKLMPQSHTCCPSWTSEYSRCAPATLRPICHPPLLDLPSRRKIMLSYSVFPSGCPAKSRPQKTYQLKISAV